MIFSQEMIDTLREQVRNSMSERRFVHTAEVEKMAVRLGELYAPDKLDVLAVAALLHDITKEKSTEEQLSLLSSHNIELKAEDRLSPKTLHARTAVIFVKERFPFFATEEVINAIRRHTTGSADMTLCDMIIYLADYIDMSRTFDDCVFLREYFWGKDPRDMEYGERYRHLLQTLAISFDMTIKALIEEKSVISVETVEARNALICNLQ